MSKTLRTKTAEKIKASKARMASQKQAPASEGDAASVVVEMPLTSLQSGEKVPNRATIELVKEGGAWKVNSPMSFKAVE